MYQPFQRIRISNPHHIFTGNTGTIEKNIGTDQDGHIYQVRMDNGLILKLWHYAIEKDT